MNLTRIAFTIFIVATLSSCVPDKKWTPMQATERALKFPTGYYEHVVYLGERIVGFASNRLPPEQRITFAYEGDTTQTPFNPENDPKCLNYSYFEVVSILPDGRLGLLKECNDASAATIYLSTNRSIYAYDWQTGELERLVAGKLAQGSRPKFYSWNPDMTLGVQATISGFPGTIYWIEPAGMTPMDIEIEDRNLTWNLKDYFEEKEHIGTVRNPAWSPDGKTIAFFVTTYGIRETPYPKDYVNYDLFFMDPSTLKPVPELMDIADASYKIVWSPDSKYLLFRGCVGRRLTCGLWRYKISDKSLSLIVKGNFADYIWITNEKIIAIKFTDDTYSVTEIFEYSFSE